MKVSINIILCFIIITILNSCGEKSPNINKSGEDELKSLEIEEPLDQKQINFEDVIYVPIYSDIYVSNVDREHLLSATLSIRNTSADDSLYISKIDYFDTKGNLVRSYIDNTISLRPMETVNYIIEKEDEIGGSGANFIVKLSAKDNQIRPLVHAIMVGKSSNHSFSFLTDGYSIKEQ